VPPYPYFKVVIVADCAEIAALPCDGVGSENIVFHGDLLSVLHQKQPELAERAFTPGRLVLDNTEAFLHIAASNPVTEDEAEEIGRALGGWCEAKGVTKLTISGTSRRSGAEPEPVSEEEWDIEDRTPST
jgi:hypothetical protein